MRRFIGGGVRARLSNARHEVAHAVIAIRLGARVRHVELYREPKGEDLGQCVFYPGQERRGFFRYALTCMAGPCADQEFNPREPRNRYSSGDRELILSLGFQRDDLHLLRDIVRPWVKKDRTVIDRVARMVASTGKATGRQIESAMGIRRKRK